MQDSIIQQIKDKLDIVEVVGSYLKLQKTGINYRAICPFHSEKNPSFFVSPSRQMFKCFSCGEGGSIFDFIMKIEGVEFGDALKILADRAGVELKTDRSYKQFKTIRQRFYEMYELSCLFFEKQLSASSKGGKEAEEYLLKRGLKKETIKKWRLGYAPNQWTALSDFLVGKGYTRKELVKAGLAVQKGSKSYDRFRGRIMFPIFDLNSQVVAFGARVMPGKESIAKYINSPATMLYDKSRILYGLNFAKKRVREENFIILTEGYMDTILSHQAMVENTIAAAGTALTKTQLKIIKRYTENLYISFDMDSAGEMATNRSIELAEEEGFNIKTILLPKDKDPADIILENPEIWRERIKKAEDVFDFYFQYAFSNFDSRTPNGQKKISQFLLPKIGSIANKIVQAHWVKKLAEGLGVDEEPVWEELKRITKKEELKESLSSKQEQDGSGLKANTSKQKEADKNRKRLLEERILFLALKNNKNFEKVGEEDINLFSPLLKQIFLILQKAKGAAARKKALEKVEKDNNEIKKVLDEALFMGEIEDFGAEEGEAAEIMEKEIEICLQEFRKAAIKERLEFLEREIRLCEKNKEEKKLLKLVEEFNSISKKLKAFN